MLTRFAVIAALLSGCGVKKYLPGRPVLRPPERAAFDAPRPAEVTYVSDPAVDFPVLPVQVWGVAYDLDLVLVSDHPRYDMHEYARVQTPDGPVWLAKDALSATRLQSIVADLPDLDQWVPELPIARKAWPLRVEDRSAGDWLDLDLAYENLEGEPVRVHYEGRSPRTRPQRRRNGNTMGHSASVVMAVLDIPYRAFARRASIHIDGEARRIRRLLGLAPLRVALVQSQGGLAVGRIRQARVDGAVHTTWTLDAGDATRAWTERRDGAHLELAQPDPFRTLVYRYAVRDDGALELERMEVRQFGVDSPVVTIALQPALPDLRRRFEGRAVSRFVVDMDDQPGHAVGRLEAWWDGDVARVALRPEAPAWVTDRPMDTEIRYADGAAYIHIARVPAGAP